jgi:hypothetical protein
MSRMVLNNAGTVWWAAALGLICIALGGSARADVAPDPAAAAFFETKVRPVLAEHCFKCHSTRSEKVKGDLYLDSREGLLRGGELGHVVTPGEPDKSLLVDAISYQAELKMPPTGRLKPQEIADLTKWVQMGAPWPGAAGPTPPAKKATNEKADALKARLNHWAWQPVKAVEPPAVKDAGWVRNPIDRFVLAKLEGAGLKPALPADKRVLIRRAYYDLIGLPPKPEAVEAFVNDPAPDAYEKLIDSLLENPHYGEKWGRHWLDLVRYAETNSYERDNAKPNIWRYRDYVIRSFNEDKPYDRFLKEQLAGDELPDADRNPDNFIATGFYRLGIWDDEPADREQHRADQLDDIVTTIGNVMLGVTIDCARCHDHKIDPVPQKDYYRLTAFLQNLTDFQNGAGQDERAFFAPDREGGREEYERKLSAYNERVRVARAAVEEMQRDYNQLVEGEQPDASKRKPIEVDGARVLGEERFRQYKRLVRALQKAQQEEPDVDKALVASERGPTAPETFLMMRGSAHALGDKVEPGFLTALGGGDAVLPKPAPGAKTSGRRTILADWIASGENRQTARVMANRIWQYHFGRGIVRSSNDFGMKGEPPTHPELLDWLAKEFVARGWSMKSMHRLLMTSSAYRMSSQGDATALAKDPRNDLFWRFDMRRLTAEELRDSVLATNGTLNVEMFGPSVYPPIPKEVLAGQSVPGKGWFTSGPEDAARRSVYIHVKRSLRVPIIEAFDGAETDKSCPVRFVTVQPTQALSMVNGSFMNDEAAKLAKRVAKEAAGDTRSQVALAVKLVTQRPAKDAEIERGLKLIDELLKQDKASPETAMKYFCLVALNLNEFVYLD